MYNCLDGGTPTADPKSSKGSSLNCVDVASASLSTIGVFMKHLFCVNHLYLDGNPFALGYNLGDLGYLVRFVSISGGVSHPVHFASYLNFLSLFGSISSRISLGVPFPIVNSSDSDVK